MFLQLFLGQFRKQENWILMAKILNVSLLVAVRNWHAKKMKMGKCRFWTLSSAYYFMILHIYIYIYLEPETFIDRWLLRLDDSKSLFKQTSISNWFFGVAGICSTNYLRGTFKVTPLKFNSEFFFRESTFGSKRKGSLLWKLGWKSPFELGRDLTQPKTPKGSEKEGKSLAISWKSRLVKHYSLARFPSIFKGWLQVCITWICLTCYGDFLRIVPG